MYLCLLPPRFYPENALVRYVQQIPHKQISCNSCLHFPICCLLAQMVKIGPQCRRPGFDPWVGKMPWRRAWQPIPVFLPGESPRTEDPGGLQSLGSQRVGHNLATKNKTARL